MSEAEVNAEVVAGEDFLPADAVKESGDAAGAQEADQVAAGPAQPLSKNQMKKLQKAEKLAAWKAERKAAEKAQKKEYQAKRLEALQTLTEEERAEKRERAKAMMQARTDKQNQKRDKMRQSLQSGLKLVVDLDFEDKMGDNERRSLCQQLSYSYSCNTRADTPVHLHLTSLGGKIKAAAQKQLSGLDHWFVTKTEQHFMDHFQADKERLVYLTADSSNEIDTLDPQAIYIIGGLVDHNQHKGLCHNLAQQHGIKTARLPIQKYVRLESSTVLAVNHVVQLLVEYVSEPNWAAVLDRVLPQRKRADKGQGQKQAQAQGQAAQEGQQQGQQGQAVGAGAAAVADGETAEAVANGGEAVAELGKEQEAVAVEDGEGARKRKAEGEPGSD